MGWWLEGESAVWALNNSQLWSVLSQWAPDTATSFIPRSAVSSVRKKIQVRHLPDEQRSGSSVLSGISKTHLRPETSMEGTTCSSCAANPIIVSLPNYLSALLPLPIDSKDRHYSFSLTSGNKAPSRIFLNE